MKKRISLFLSVLLCLTALIAVCCRMPARAETVSEGTCGETLSWSLDDKGLLTVTGTGAMDEWNSSVSVPWNPLAGSVLEVEISDGVTNVGAWAFYGCKNLTKLSLPDTVTDVGIFACAELPALKEIRFSAALQTIGDSAFMSCTALTQVTLPSSLKTLGMTVFLGCRSLSAIGVDGAGAFSAEHGVLYGDGGKTLCVYPAGKPDASFTVPDGVTAVSTAAFAEAAALQEVTLPESLTGLGDLAFSGCPALTRAVLPEGITTLPSYLFARCASLTDVVIPASVQEIGGGAFSECASLAEVRLPDGLLTLGEGAFSGCKALTALSLPDSLREIGFPMADGCVSLTEIKAGDKNPAYLTENGALYNKDKTALLVYPAGVSGAAFTVPEGVTKIEAYAFADGGVTAVTVPDSVTEIGSAAFRNCKNLTAVTLSENIETLPWSAFAGCESLTSAVLPEGLTDVGMYAFSGCKALEEITLPSTLKNVSLYAFDGCTALKDVYFGGTKSGFAAVQVMESNDPLLQAALHPDPDATDPVTAKPSGVTTAATPTTDPASTLQRLFLNDTFFACAAAGTAAFIIVQLWLVKARKKKE